MHHLLFIFLIFLNVGCFSNNEPSSEKMTDPNLPTYNDSASEKMNEPGSPTDVIVGAERPELYLDKCKGKNVGVVANQTSIVNGVHLVDFLVANGVSVKAIFCPEHGFRGNAGAGEHIDDSIDPKTGIPVISLYGNHRKPTAADLKNLDLVLFDLQDVGVRFYTYISTLTYVMEACADYNVPVIILDRPNPNAHYVDGPVLKSGYESFVGLHHVPVVYGMTIGEYGLMVNGEGWLSTSSHSGKCNLTVIPIDNYTHTTIYQLPVNPSPNLQTMNAIWLYPTVCLFEGTVVSVGRGTGHPFEIVGHPELKTGDTIFTPVTIPGVVTNPKFENTPCKGYSLVNDGISMRNSGASFIDIQLVIKLYNELKLGESFFTSYFKKLVGSDELQRQIMSGMPAEEIRSGWQPELDSFKAIRSKYLIYQ